MIELPPVFLKRMEDSLGSADYGKLLLSYEEPAVKGLRVNKLKKRPHLQERLKELFSLSPIPWEELAFYYPEGERPGAHSLHEAGAYYLQEPSAMLPVQQMELEPGLCVLDLCAAPGGKSTQIAARLEGRGLLVANEINPGRAAVLSENIERMGIRNAVVTQESPQSLSMRFSGFFDRILVDAPCSGEGMFRKNPEVAKEWSMEAVAGNSARQKQILDAASAMLKPGGIMVYSTCTFSEAEDEEVAEDFLSRHREYSLRHIRKYLPYDIKGEGHFCASFEKMDGNTAYRGRTGKSGPKGLKGKVLEPFRDFFKEYAIKDVDLDGNYTAFGENLYLLPEECPALSGLKVLRAGLSLGRLKEKRFEPGHALALTLGKEDAVLWQELTYEEAERYISGETLIQNNGEKGWRLLSVDGCTFAWGKGDGRIIKNHYPKGLRKRLYSLSNSKRI